MSIIAHRKLLESRRRLLQRQLKNLQALQRGCTATAPDRMGPLSVCYDNRHKKTYYQNWERRTRALQAQKNLSLEECEEVINQALGWKYYQGICEDLREENLENPAAKKTSPESSLSEHAALLRTALYHFKIKGAPKVAENYLNQALTLSSGPALWGRIESTVYRSALYEYLSLVAEERGQLALADKYLSQALQRPLENINEHYKIKYQYLKRALLAIRQQDPQRALTDLARALTMRPTGRRREIDIFYLDDLILWEQTKVHRRQGRRRPAQQKLVELINMCKLNYNPPNKAIGVLSQDELLALLTKYQGHLATTALGRVAPQYQTPPPGPELPDNYGSFQVNAKCPIYQNFIVRTRAKKNKTAQDWKYLVAYEFSRHSLCRPYECVLGPTQVTPAALVLQTTWRAGVEEFFIQRNYIHARQVITAALKKTPDYLGYELAAKVNMALGDYAAALASLTEGITQAQKNRCHQPLEAATPEQVKVYHLLRGIAYAQMRDPVAADAEFGAGLRIHLILDDFFPKLNDLFYWERAKVRKAAGQRTAALKDLENIKQNPVVKEFSVFLQKN